MPRTYRHRDPGRSIGRERLPIPEGWPGMVWAHEASPHGHPRHTHDEPEANLVLRGQATYQIGTREVTLRRGDLVWLGGEVEHVLAEQSDDFHMWIIVLRRTPAWPAGPAGIPAEAAVRHLDPATFRLANQTCAWLANHAQVGHARTAIPWLLTLLWQGFASAAAATVTGHPAVAQARRLLESGDLPLTTVAHRTGLTPDRLGRLFRAETGMTLVAFRARARLERALRLVEDRGVSLSEAASAAGFGSYSRFHRAFRAVHGTGPRDHLASSDPHGG